MEDCDLFCLESGNVEDVSKILINFIDKHNQTFTFHDLNQNGKRKKLWTALFNHLDNLDGATCHKHCLICIRLLSREKLDLDNLICEKWMDILLRHASLVSQEEALRRINEPAVNYEVMLESLKCLCNLVFNSVAAQTLACRSNAVEGLLMRLRTYRDPELPYDIKLFDMKMLFLVTALCSEVRPRLRDQLHGLTYLMETLDLVLKEGEGHHEGEQGGATQADARITLTDQQVGLACEVLKVLFNLTMRTGDRGPVDEEDEAHFLRLVSILHDLLLCRAETGEKLSDLRNHTVNLLMSIPGDCYQELMSPIQEPGELPKDVEFEGRNMEAVAVLLEFLEHRLDLAAQDVKAQHEMLSPILSVMLEGSRYQRTFRKFLRCRVLPPLTEVFTRPEEGPSLRNKLCRLLTTPVTQVRDLTADFLFVLCKENVLRMVKYTGYGNAAGFLANRGLLLGGNTSGPPHYSSDSEDSDTEEYRAFRNQINPLPGCVESPKPDRFANMTEEQKEYEAMQLVNMMDKLARDGIMQPGRIGEDGRPEPVDHIMQLVEELPRQQVRPPRSSEDN